MLPKISVVIPSLNSGKFIGELLWSIMAQSYPNLEVIVMDGGSTNGTVKILKAYQEHIVWWSHKDNGTGAAANDGLSMASGDIVTLMCADDVYKLGSLHKVADCFMRYPDTKWALGKCQIIDEQGQEIRRNITHYKDFFLKHYNYNYLLVSDFIPQPSVFWRKELADEMGLFRTKPTDIGMDYDYWLRIGAKYKPAYIDEYLTSCRLHQDSKSSKWYVRDARIARDIAVDYAKAQLKQYLVPLQYLNYLAVVSIYSLLNRGKK